MDGVPARASCSWICGAMSGSVWWHAAVDMSASILEVIVGCENAWMGGWPGRTLLMLMAGLDVAGACTCDPRNRGISWSSGTPVALPRSSSHGLRRIKLG